MKRIRFDSLTRSFSLDNVTVDNKNKAREYDKQSRSKLKDLWRNYHSAQRINATDRMNTIKEKIDSETSKMLASKDISKTQPGTPAQITYPIK